MSKIDTQTRKILFEKLKKSGKITDSSALVYVRTIVRLHKLSETKINIMKPAWLTQKLAKKIKENSQARHLFLAGVKLLQALEIKKGKRWDLWYGFMIQSSNAYKTERGKAKLSDKEIKKISGVTFKSFCKTVRKLIPPVRRTLTKSLDSITLKNVLRIQDVLVLLFFCEVPLRNELANVKISDLVKNKDNHFQKNKSGYTLILNDHKTVKNVGARRHKLTKSLARILNKFIPMVKKITDHDYLLTTARGNRMTPNSLSKYLVKITKELFPTGFSSQIIRILFAQDKLKGLKALTDAQEALGHADIQTTMSYAKT